MNDLRHTGPSGTDARLTPVSGGDAIIEPFWDPALAAWQKWSQTAAGVQAHCEQYWCMVTLDWTAVAPGAGPTLLRSYAGDGVAMGPYSHLVLSAGFPKGTTITLRAATDAGRFERTFVGTVSHTDQHVLPLPQASRLRHVEIALGAAAAGPMKGNLLWLGLRDPQRAAVEAEAWEAFADQPLAAFLRG